MDASQSQVCFRHRRRQTVTSWSAFRYAAVPLYDRVLSLPYTADGTPFAPGWQGHGHRRIPNMKNQYFADRHDLFKYDLVLHLMRWDSGSNNH